MTWVKICGMTSLEDALTAVEAGADAVGFVFYEKSPRNITVEAAREIVEKLPERVEKIGVFVGQSAEQVSSISERAELSAVQVYPSSGDGPGSLTDFVQNVQCRMFVAMPGQRVTSEESFGFFFSEEFLRRTSAVFLDSGNSQHPGGTGTAFDWDNAAQPVSAMSRTIPVVIAGGLTPQNVGAAIRTLQPWGVDVASGVETRPGKKDPEKMRAFVKAVRAAERSA
ncbi:MAG: phosphoribosylanthranilate isomerase [Candidatus Sulfotelmatobacter sp.]